MTQTVVPEVALDPADPTLAPTLGPAHEPLREPTARTGRTLSYLRDLIHWRAEVRADAQRLAHRIDTVVSTQNERIADLSAEIDMHRRFLAENNNLEQFTRWRISNRPVPPSRRDRR